MTVPTNTVTAFAAIGNREDLSDVIYNISPTDFPFMQMAGRTKATNVFHEWQTDTLDAAAANRQIEGDDATAKTFVATVRIGNYHQIASKTVSVSGTQRSADSAGRADELSYQIARRGKELKRDMEYALVRNQASSAGGTGTARSLASVESWLATNKTSLGTGTAQTTPGYSSGTVATPTDSSTAGTFTKAGLDAVIRACWTQGGEPKVIMVGPFNRTLLSGFTGISTLQTPANAQSDTTLMGAIDYYKSNFGTLKVVPNRFSRDQTALVLDMDYWAVSFYRPIQMTPLAKTGDSDRAMMLCEFTLESRNEAASGKVTDLTTS